MDQGAVLIGIISIGLYLICAALSFYNARLSPYRDLRVIWFICSALWIMQAAFGVAELC